MRSTNPHTESEAYHALAIAYESNYRAIDALLSANGSWLEAWNNAPTEHRTKTTGRAPLVDLAKQGIRLILRTDADFPPLLREIPWAPHAIYVRGVLPKTDMPTIAIVGTRKATPTGKEAARIFAEAFVRAGCVVASGLALGIDAAAHDGAVQANGITLVVLATGLDRIYPQTNAFLAERILKNGGALISEYPPGSPTLPYRFLERNRIVSGLSQGIVLIEAPRASGSLATARFALDQNRSIFVIPGPATHPNFAGSHDLIRAGAMLVTEPAHVLEDLGVETESVSISNEKLNPEESAILEALRSVARPVEIDKIIELTHLETHIVNRTLSYLIIRNLVTESAGAYAEK